jgi:hypothetical protein
VRAALALVGRRSGGAGRKAGAGRPQAEQHLARSVAGHAAQLVTLSCWRWRCRCAATAVATSSCSVKGIGRGGVEGGGGGGEAAC